MKWRQWFDKFSGLEMTNLYGFLLNKKPLKQTLQEKEQQTLRLARKMRLSGMDAAQIADLLEVSIAEVVALFGND